MHPSDRQPWGHLVAAANLLRRKVAIISLGILQGRDTELEGAHRATVLEPHKASEPGLLWKRKKTSRPYSRSHPRPGGQAHRVPWKATWRCCIHISNYQKISLIPLLNPEISIPRILRQRIPQMHFTCCSFTSPSNEHRLQLGITGCTCTLSPVPNTETSPT